MAALPAFQLVDGGGSPAAVLLIEKFLSSIDNVNTRRSYEVSLKAFARFQWVDREAAVARLLACSQGEVNMLALDFRAHLRRRHLAPASVNRHLSVLRGFLRFGRLVGKTALIIEVRDLPHERYRDVSGPSPAEILRLLAAIEGRGGRVIGIGDDGYQVRRDLHKERDRALITLIYTLGLRRAEALSLRLRDVSLGGRAVWILGKGRKDREKLTLPPDTADALAAWMRVRNAALPRSKPDSPLFPTLYQPWLGKAIDGRAVGYLFRRLGKLAGVTVRPHGLRHSAITQVLNLNHGDLRKAQRFSRHKNLNTLLIYDDSRIDYGGRMAKLLSADLERRGKKSRAKPVPE